jgi:hypothetical protein
MLLQMNFILGASSRDRVFRVILASMALQGSHTDIKSLTPRVSFGCYTICTFEYKQMQIALKLMTASFLKLLV